VSGQTPVMIALVAVLLLFDCQNLIAVVRRAVRLPAESSSDYTLIVPLFGDPRVLSNMDFLAKHKQHTLLVLNTTNAAMVEFAERVEREGWRTHRTHYRESKPCVSRLWQDGLDAVETTYAIRFDADTTSAEDPGRAIRALELAGADYASAKVLVHEPRSLVAHLQAAEYAMSMQARHFRPWMTSGACVMGRTQALRTILAKHTHWWIGEDVEQGIIAKHFRMRVAHIDYRVYTDAPATFRALFRQRRLWWAGSVRQTIVNVDHMLRFPAYLFYNLVLVYVGFTLRGHFLAATPLQFAAALPTMLLAYVVITSVANYRVWSPWFLIFPAYSLMQAVVMPGVGVVEFARMALRLRSSGRYVIRWRREHWTPGRSHT
jgi:cellulose synthase/poly-beta-1,6-N-acetylglucosamine synthase-like glycosyltransferase